MIHSYSTTELMITAFWSDNPAEDHIVLVDHTTLNSKGLPEIDQAWLSEWEELMRDGDDKHMVAVGQLNSGKVFAIEPLLDIIRLSRVEAAMRSDDGTE